MKTILITLAIIGTMSLSAQTIEKQIIGATGGTSTAGTVIVTATVGEVAVKTLLGTLTLTQGYQQGSTGPVSVEEIQVTSNYKLYPNPTTNGSKLEITTLNLDADASVLLYSKEGKLLSTQVVKLTSGVKSTVKIDLKSKAKGIYFVKILDSKNKTSKTLRVVKQ